MTAKRWTYAEITCSVEGQIEELLTRSEAQHNERQRDLYHSQAFGVYLAWLRLTLGHEVGDDDARLKKMFGL